MSNTCGIFSPEKEPFTWAVRPSKYVPDMAVFAPAGMLHRIDVDSKGDLTYVVVYAPPGPEKLLKKHGAHAFDAR